jgi:hypothetical protein
MRERLVSSLRVRRRGQPQIHRAVRAHPARRKVRLPPLSLGSQDKDGIETAVELEYPAESAGSLKRFYAATYTHGGLYTQSVCFVSGNFGYTVFTRSRGVETVAAGVDVRDRKSGRTTTISCSEQPRFYIFELKGLVPCDPETPVGTACVK